MEEEGTTWVKLSLAEKTEFEELINSDLVFPAIGYLFSHLEKGELNDEDEFFYEIVDDSIVFIKRKNPDEEKNDEE